MYNLLSKTTDIPARKISWTKNINLRKTSWGKYFLTHLKSPKTVQFNGSKAELIIKFSNKHFIIKKLNLLEIQKCTFCNKTDETIEHLLWECKCVKRFLNELISWLIQHRIHILLNENHSYLE